MNKKKLFITLGFLLLTAVLLTAGVSEYGSSRTRLRRTANALGGVNRLLALETIRFTATGEFVEFHQDGSEIEELENIAANFSYEQTAQLNQRTLRQDWQQQFVYPFGYEGDFSIIIADQTGSIEGAHGFGSRYFGYNAPAPLYSSRLEAIWKTQFLANPLELVQHAVINQGVRTRAENNTFTIPLGNDLPDVELIVNPRTGLPKSARVLEADALLGDVVFEVKYQQWQRFGRLKYPAKLTYWLDGQLIREETISDIAFNESFAVEQFVPTAVSEYDAAQGRYGILSSQWYNRMGSYGFSQDQPLTETSISPLGGNVYLVAGSPELAYISLVVKTDAGLVLVEPALNQRRSEAILAAIDEAFPDDEITAVFATHHHMDHFGGVRTFAAEAETIYVGETAVSFTEDVLSSSPQLWPDRLSQNPNMVNVVGIDDVTTVGQGDEAFQIYPLATEHSDDMLLLYFPSIKALYVADIFNGGMVYGWDYYTAETQTVIGERAHLLNEFISNNGLDVETILSTHGAPAPISELQDLISK